MMKVLVLINSRSGQGSFRIGGADGESERIVREAMRGAGVAHEVRAVEGSEIAPHAKAAVDGEGGDVSAVVAAGGDGTVDAVATALVGTEKPMGVLPLGTLNHFAKDAGLPLKVDEAARVIAGGAIRAVDVGEVNGRVFVNNSSIGLYPHAVVKRDRQMERLGRGKWLALLVAWVSVFRRFPFVRVRMRTGDGHEVACDSPFVFIGNNRYELSGMNLGARMALDRGELCVYYAKRAGRWAMVALALRALVGRLDQARDFETLCVKELTLETRKKTLRVAVDGEVVRMTPPLVYRVREGALRVVGGR